MNKPDNSQQSDKIQPHEYDSLTPEDIYNRELEKSLANNKLYQFADKVGKGSKTMQHVGNDMQRAGCAQTMGCLVLPFLMFIVFAFLFLI